MAIRKTALAASAAASLLGAAGAVHASAVGTSPANIKSVVSISGTPIGNATATGTGTLDSSGVLNVSSAEMMVTSYAQTLAVSSTDMISGTISGSTFTASSGTTELTSCTGGSFCGSAGVGTTKAFTSVSGTLSLTSGGTGAFTAVAHPSGTNQTVTYDLRSFSPADGPPPISLPPAGLLLGSGLLGLVGTARRHRKR
jgi:hypothetical protein